MSRKINKLISQEISKYYGEVADEETKALSKGNDEFDGSDNKFKEACA